MSFVAQRKHDSYIIKLQSLSQPIGQFGLDDSCDTPAK